MTIPVAFEDGSRPVEGAVRRLEGAARSVALTCLVALSAGSAAAEVAPSDLAIAREERVRLGENTVACRDLSDMLRLAILRRERAERPFLEAYRALKAAGVCGPVWAGDVAELEGTRDEQGFRFVCLRLHSAEGCVWADDPSYASIGR